jgi:hypothetical protein
MQSHTGEELAATFAKVLEDFGISEKVSKQPGGHVSDTDSPFVHRSSALHVTMLPITL